MNLQRIRIIALQIRLSAARLGAGALAAIALCVIGIAGWVWGISYLEARAQAQQVSIKRAQLALRTAENAPVDQRPAGEIRLDGFYSALGEQRYAEQQVKSLFGIAQKAGVALTRAEYRSAYDKVGGYHTYQIVLPVKGSYGSVRRFCEQTLLAIPFASLDELAFRRDGIGNSTLEAKLRFTLYLSDAVAPARERDDVPAQEGGI